MLSNSPLQGLGAQRIQLLTGWKTLTVHHHRHIWGIAAAPCSIQLIASFGKRLQIEHIPRHLPETYSTYPAES